jgi:hypothetical protein
MMSQKVMQRVNPTIKEDLEKIYSKGLDKEEAERFSNLINTGYEGYARTTEEDQVKAVLVYLKEQDKLMEEYKDKGNEKTFKASTEEEIKVNKKHEK